MTRSAGIAIALALLAACSRLPVADAGMAPPPPGQDYPALLPISDILAIDAGIPEGSAEEDAALKARADALRARAAGLSAR